MLSNGKKASMPDQWDLKVHILLVEDNPGDVRLIQEALKTTELQYVLDIASHGDEAIARLLTDSPHIPLPIW